MAAAHGQPGPVLQHHARALIPLVPSPATLQTNPYLPFAVLETTDPATQARRLFAVNLQRILAGEQDYTLRDSDRLIVLSAADIRFL